MCCKCVCCDWEVLCKWELMLGVGDGVVEDGVVNVKTL